MVNAALSLGAAVGVLLSAGFVWWQVGRYAAPQVPESRFDERKEMIAYTAGLFVGIPLVVPLLGLFQSIPPFEIGGIALYLALLVAGCELAQWLLLRSVYFGKDGSGPFYALGFRAGVAGILILALVAEYFSRPTYSASAVAGVLAISLGILGLESVSAILALPNRADRPGRATGPFTAVPLEAIGFFFLGFASGSSPGVAVIGGLLIASMAGWLFRSIASPNLSIVPPPGGKVRVEELAKSTFGRLDRP
jgi:hypothetical protein